MTEEAGVTKRLRRNTEIDADLAKVQFSPEVVAGFARLEALVHDSPHFNPEIRENLRDLASGKTFDVHLALTEMALIAQNTMRHVTATGDTRAEQALDDPTSDMMGVGRGGDSKPIALFISQRRNR
jgi:hypothetical protein